MTWNSQDQTDKVKTRGELPKILDIERARIEITRAMIERVAAEGRSDGRAVPKLYRNPHIFHLHT